MEGESCQVHFKVPFQVAAYMHSMRGMSKTLEGGREGEAKADNSSSISPFSLPLCQSPHPSCSHTPWLHILIAEALTTQSSLQVPCFPRCLS